MKAANIELCRTCVDYKECKSGGKLRNNPLAHCTNGDSVMERRQGRGDPVDGSA